MTLLLGSIQGFLMHLKKNFYMMFFAHHGKVMQKHETIESTSQTTKKIETPFNKDNSPYDAQTTQRKKELVDNIFQYVIEHDALEDSQHYISMADNREKEQIKKLKPYPPPPYLNRTKVCCMPFCLH